MAKQDKTLQAIQIRINEARQALKLEKAVEMVNKHLEGTQKMTDMDAKVCSMVFKAMVPVFKQIDHTLSADSDLAEFLQAARAKANAHDQRRH